MTKEFLISCYASLIWRYATGRATEMAEIFHDLAKANIRSAITMDKNANLQYKSNVIETTLINPTKWHETIRVNIADKSVTVKDTYELELFLARI